MIIPLIMIVFSLFVCLFSRMKQVKKNQNHWLWMRLFFMNKQLSIWKTTNINGHSLFIDKSNCNLSIFFSPKTMMKLIGLSVAVFLSLSLSLFIVWMTFENYLIRLFRWMNWIALKVYFWNKWRVWLNAFIFFCFC